MLLFIIFEVIDKWIALAKRRPRTARDEVNKKQVKLNSSENNSKKKFEIKKENGSVIDDCWLAQTIPFYVLVLTLYSTLSCHE